MYSCEAISFGKGRYCICNYNITSIVAIHCKTMINYCSWKLNLARCYMYMFVSLIVYLYFILIFLSFQEMPSSLTLLLMQRRRNNLNWNCRYLPSSCNYNGVVDLWVLSFCRILLFYCLFSMINLLHMLK